MNGEERVAMTTRAGGQTYGALRAGQPLPLRHGGRLTRSGHGQRADDGRAAAVKRRS